MLATDRPLQSLDARQASVPPGCRRDELEQKIETELVKHLVRQARGGLTGFAIGTATVAAVLIVLWNAAPRSLLLTWLISIGLLTLPAFVLVWRFTDGPDAVENIASWRRALGVAYGLAGAGWGAAAILLSPVHGVLEPQVLSEWMLADRLPARLQLQLHKYIWSPQTRGV